MRLTSDHSLAAGSTYVSCLKCGKRVTIASTLIDMDGPSFQAYYCEDGCAPEGMVARCRDIDTRGCCRGGRSHA